MRVPYEVIKISDVFNAYINRSDAAASLPVELADELVAGIAKSSAALSLGHQVPMTVLENQLPLLTTLPQAFWNVDTNSNPIDGTPSGLTQTTLAEFSLNPITAYEAGTIVAIPQNVLDDSQVPLWDTIRPRVAEALASVLDQASIWGVNKPVGANQSVIEFIAAASGGRVAINDGTTASSTTVTDANASSTDVGSSVYGPGIPSGTTVASVSAGVHLVLSAAATVTGTATLLILPANPGYVIQGNTFNTAPGEGADYLSYLLQAAQRVAQGSYTPTAAWIPPGAQYRYAAPRTQQLVANPVGSGVLPYLLGGLPIAPFAGINGDAKQGTGVIWNPFCDGIVGDWSALKIGVRKDITLTMHTEGVISDNNGVVQYNLMQAGGAAVRATARWSWVILQPPVADTSFVGTRSVFAMVQNTGTAGNVGATGPIALGKRKDIPLTAPIPGAQGVRGTNTGARSGRRNA